MKKIKVIFFYIILLIIFFSNTVIGNPFTLKVYDKGSKNEKNLPKGLSQITIYYIRNINYPGLGGKIFTPTAGNLFKYKDILPFIETIMKNSNIDFNLKNLEIIEDQIYIIVSKAWRDAIKDLMECESLKKSHNGKALKEFLDNLEKEEWPFSFSNEHSQFDMYAWNETTGVGNQLIKFPYEELEDIVKYIVKKMKQNPDDIDIRDYQDDLKILYSYIGHEILHAFTKKKGRSFEVLKYYVIIIV